MLSFLACEIVKTDLQDTKGNPTKTNTRTQMQCRLEEKWLEPKWQRNGSGCKRRGMNHDLSETANESG